MDLRPGDIVDYEGRAFAVTGIVAFDLGGRPLRLAHLNAADKTLYLELTGNPMSDRVLVLAEIPLLDVGIPPPAVLYHGGESYLPQLSGEAEVTMVGNTQGLGPGPCAIWRYRAAGDRYLQIEAWPSRVRVLAGATAHRSMIEVRPAQT